MTSSIFQDGGRDVAILLSISFLVTSLKYKYTYRPNFDEIS